MADAKISALTDGNPLTADDEIAIARSAASFKAKPTGVDGWVSDTAETWTYASGSGGGVATFTVSGDVRSKYTVGTRIKLTQTTVKYFVVSADPTFASSTTTVTIHGGSDYTLANAAISANYHSYMANPQGYPGWFNFTASPSGWSGTPTVTARFAVTGRTCTLYMNITGTSNNATTTATSPIAAASTGAGASPFIVTDNGTGSATPGRAIIGGTTITFRKAWDGTNFTASGTKTIGNFAMQFEI